MKHSFRGISLILLNFTFFIFHSTFAYAPPAVVFDTPAENDRGAMYLGDGEIGALAWISADGTLHTVLQRTDSWNEIGDHIKVGQIDYATAAPVDAGSYRQELSLERGEFNAAWKSGGRPVSVHYRVQWGDDRIAVCEITGAPNAGAKNVNWRLYPGGKRETNAWETRWENNFELRSQALINEKLTLAADRQLEDLPEGMFGWCHENLNSTVDKILAIYNRTQGTGGLGKPDLLHHRCFGAITRMERGADGKTLFLSAVTCFHPCKDTMEWRKRTLEALDRHGWKLADEAAKRAGHAAGWRSFWDRSHIEISPGGGEQARYQVPRNPKLPVSFGVDSAGGNRFNGECIRAELAVDGKPVYAGAPKAGEVVMPVATGKMPVVPVGGSRSVATATDAWYAMRFSCRFKTTDAAAPQRLLDNATPGESDGFLIDLFQGRVRVLLGKRWFHHPVPVAANQETTVDVEVSPQGDASATVNGVVHRLKSAAAEECRAVNMAWAAQRYTVRCAGKGAMPLRFNGSLFTPSGNGNPDYRLWGSGFWWQNTRLPYYPMFAAGDLDMFEALFKMYNYDLLEFLKKRTRLYLGHGGAFFPECMQPWGDHFVSCYRTALFAERKDKLQVAGDHKYAWVGQLELSMMMIFHYLHTDDAEWFKAKALPAIREFVRYFDEHYKLAADGRYDWQPAQAVECWWDCTAPMTEVSGLTRVTDLLLALPPELVGDGDRALFARIRSRIPELPTRKLKDGRLTFAPAVRYEHPNLAEHPELYCVFPFRLCSFEKPNAELGRVAYEVHYPHRYHGWGQEELFSAYLGMAEETRRHLVNRVLHHVQKRNRWPVFWTSMIRDWDSYPDQDEGGIVQNVIQSMLLQFEGDKIFLAPAWPKDWNCNFKLNAPHRTTLEGRIENGKVVDLVVTPASRRRDVVVWGAAPAKMALAAGTASGPFGGANLIVNPDFETATCTDHGGHWGWFKDGKVSVEGWRGAGHAVLCTYKGVDVWRPLKGRNSCIIQGQPNEDSAWLEQSVKIAEGGAYKFSFLYATRDHFSCGNPGKLGVSVNDGVATKELAPVENVKGVVEWRRAVYDLTLEAGKTYTFRFHALKSGIDHAAHIEHVSLERVSSPAAKPLIAPNANPTPVLHFTDLYRPAWDPDDHFDAATQFALAKQGLIDLRAVIFDRHGMAEPDVCALAQLGELTNKPVPSGIGQQNLGQRPGSGMLLIKRQLEEAKSPVAIHVVGGCVDIAAAAELWPDLFRAKVKAVYLDAGSSEEWPRLECNVNYNPKAYRQALSLPCPVYWIPCYNFWSFKEYGEKAKLGAKTSRFAGLWWFKHGEVFDRLGSEMLNYFGSVLSRSRNTDWRHELAKVPDDRVFNDFANHGRAGFSIAGIFHAAGLTVWTDGTLAPLGLAPERELYRFVPVEVSCNEMGRAKWSLAEKPTGRYIIDIRDVEKYPKAMTSALAEALSWL